MYDNLRAEMARDKVTGREIAASLEMNEKTFSRCMTGKSDFTIGQAKKIVRRFFPRMTLDALFDGKEGQA